MPLGFRKADKGDAEDSGMECNVQPPKVPPVVEFGHHAGNDGSNLLPVSARDPDFTFERTINEPQ